MREYDLKRTTSTEEAPLKASPFQWGACGLVGVAMSFVLERLMPSVDVRIPLSLLGGVGAAMILAGIVLQALKVRDSMAAPDRSKEEPIENVDASTPDLRREM
jgi:hypothetical protein